MDFLINLSEGWQFTIQLLIVLICLFYGAKKGGIALGLLGGIGLIVLVFAFGIQPGKPAIAVMLTILAVVVASATLQASGGLDVMLQISEKVLRKNPKYISILAPFVTSTLTILCGTGHVVYTMLPIVYDVAIKNGIRPERPMAASSIASQMGIIASPVSVAVVTLTAFLISADHHLAGFDGYLDLLKITIPSTYLGVLCVGMFSWFRGKDLDKDLEFQGRIKDPEVKKYVYGDGTTLLGKKLPKTSWAAMWIFLGTIAVVATLGYFKDLRPAWNSNKDGAVVQIVATYPTEQKILEKIVLKDAKAEVSGSSIDISGSKVKNVANNISGLTITQKDGSKLMLSQNEQGSVIYTNVKGEVKEYPNSTISLSNKVASKTTLSMVDTIQILCF